MSGPFLTSLRSLILRCVATDYYTINDALYYIIDTAEAAQEEGQLVSKIFNSHCV